MGRITKETLGIMKKCYDAHQEGMLYAHIAEKYGLRSRGAVAGYIFRYRVLQNIPVTARTPVEQKNLVVRGMKSSDKSRIKRNRGNAQAYRDKNKAGMEKDYSDLVVIIREDGVRVTKDTKPRMAWGCGFDWKGV